MSCTFWNMRRRLRKQAEKKSTNEEKIVVDIVSAQKQAKQTDTPKKTTKKAGAKDNDNKATV